MGRPRELKLCVSTNKVVHHHTILKACQTYLLECYKWDELKDTAAWFFIYYNSIDSFAKIQSILGGNPNKRGTVSKRIIKIDNLLSSGDKEVVKAFESIKLLIEGPETMGERLYVNYLKSGKSIFEYLTKEYKE